MINKMNIGMALIVLLTSAAQFQNKDARIGDDYAKAALRTVIYTYDSGISPEPVAVLMDEADVEASTPAEEASLRELNRILGLWARRPIQDNQACYQALKANLKARSGATPEVCK